MEDDIKQDQAVKRLISEKYQPERYGRLCASGLHDFHDRPRAVYMTKPDGLYPRCGDEECLKK